MTTQQTTTPHTSRTMAPATAQAAAPAADDRRNLDRLARTLRDGSLDAKALGAAGEDYAAAWLAHHGWRILSRNWRTRYGELDIVAVTPERIVVFVEVKTRRPPMQAEPQESVTAGKQRKIAAAAARYLAGKKDGPGEAECRFDIIAVTITGEQAEIRYYPDAFYPVSV